MPDDVPREWRVYALPTAVPVWSGDASGKLDALIRFQRDRGILGAIEPDVAHGLVLTDSRAVYAAHPASATYELR